MKIEVIYALPDHADRMILDLPEGTSAQDALAQSGLLQRHPEILQDKLALGVYGKAVAQDATLKEGDRLEVYRPLKMDPKEARRLRGTKSRRA